MTETPLRNSLAGRGLFGFLLQVVLRLRGLLIIPVLTRVLPATELGVISLGNALTSGVAPLLVLGLHNGLPLRLVGLKGRDVRPALLTALSFAAAFSCVATALTLGFLSTGVLGTAFSPLFPVLLPLGLFMVGTALREIALVLPFVRQELRFIAGINLFMDFGGVIVALALVLSGFGAFGVFLGVGVMSVLGIVTAAFHSLNLAEGGWAWDRAFLKASLHTSLPAVSLAPALWTLQFSNYFFVSYHRGVANVAVYGLAYTLASPTLMVIAAINLTYLPTCVEILNQGRVPFARFIDRSSTVFAVGGVAAIAFTTSCGPALAALIGGDPYIESGRLLPVVVSGYVIFSLSQLQQFVPSAMIQDMQASARAYLLAATVNFAGNCLLIPRYGLWGAAWSTLGSYAIAFCLLSRNVRLLLPELVWTHQVARFLGLVMVSIGYALLTRSPAAGTVLAIALGSSAVLVTLTFAFVLGLVRRSDLSSLRQLRRAPPKFHSQRS